MKISERKCSCCLIIKPQLAFIAGDPLIEFLSGNQSSLQKTSRYCCSCLVQYSRRGAREITKNRSIQRDLEDSRKKKPVYSEYMKSPDWSLRKSQLKSGCGFNASKCQVCGGSYLPIHCHHLSYVRLGMEAQRDIALICGACHAAIHSDRKLKGGIPPKLIKSKIDSAFKKLGLDQDSFRNNNPEKYAKAVACLLRVENHVFVKNFI